MDGRPGTGRLGRLARWVMARRLAVVAVALVVAVVAAVIGLPPRIDSNIVALLPPDEPHAAALAADAAANGGSTGILLQFESADPALMGARLDTLAEELAALPEVAFALPGLPEGLATHAALMHLDPDATQALAAQLEAVLTFGLPAAAVVPAAQALIPDEVGLALPGVRPGQVFVKPVASNLDPDACVRVVAEVSRVVAEAGLRDDRIYNTFIGGPYVVVAQGVRGTAVDLGLTAAVSASLVVVVLVIGLRSWRAPLLVVPPLALTVLVNLAFLRMFVGSVNLYTSIGAAVLLGLGIDFAIHLLGRYREERAKGEGIEDAVAAAWDRSGPPCITAALTSAAGFLALLLADFRGISQLGLSLSVGLVACLVAMLVLLPALISWIDPSERPLLGAAVVADGVGLSPVAARVGLVVLVVATVAVGAFAVRGLSFDYDFTALGRDEDRFANLAPQAQDLTRQAFPPVVVTVAEPAGLVDEHARLEGLVASGALPHIRSVISLESLLPFDQAERIPPLVRLRALADHPRAATLPEGLRTALDALEPWVPRVHTVDDLPPGLAGFFLNGRKILLIPQGELYDMRVSGALVDELDAVVDGAAGVQLTQGVLARLVVDDMPVVVIVALILVAVLTAVHLRRLVPTILAVGSLLVGLVWATGLAAALGIHLNLANLVALPILLGIGVDVVIHLADQLRADPSLVRAYRTVGVAAALSTVTTMASFVALNAAGSGGVRSLGQLVTLGLASVATVSAVTLALGWRATSPGSARTRTTAPPPPPPPPTTTPSA